MPSMGGLLALTNSATDTLSNWTPRRRFLVGIIHFKLCDAMIHCDGGDGELLRDQEEGLESRRDKNSKDRLPPITRNIALLYSGHQKSIANRHLSGRHRWIDYSQDDFNASQVPPEWHSWIHHIRKDAPTDDVIMKQLSPPWKAVSFFPLSSWVLAVMGTVAMFVQKTSH